MEHVTTKDDGRPCRIDCKEHERNDMTNRMGRNCIDTKHVGLELRSSHGALED